MTQPKADGPGGLCPVCERDDCERWLAEKRGEEVALRTGVHLNCYRVGYERLLRLLREGEAERDALRAERDEARAQREVEWILSGKAGARANAAESRAAALEAEVERLRRDFEEYHVCASNFPNEQEECTPDALCGRAQAILAPAKDAGGQPSGREQKMEECRQWLLNAERTGVLPEFLNSGEEVVPSAVPDAGGLQATPGVVVQSAAAPAQPLPEEQLSKQSSDLRPTTRGSSPEVPADTAKVAMAPALPTQGETYYGRDSGDTGRSCSICKRPVRAERLSDVRPASHATGYCWRKELDLWHETECNEIGRKLSPAVAAPSPETAMREALEAIEACSSGGKGACNHCANIARAALSSAPGGEK